MNLLYYHHARNSECLPRQANDNRLHHPLEHGAEQPDEKAQRDLKRCYEEPTKVVSLADEARKMIMQHKCKVTVLETKVFSNLQEKYRADSQSAPYLLFAA